MTYLMRNLISLNIQSKVNNAAIILLISVLSINCYAQNWSINNPTGPVFTEIQKTQQRIDGNVIAENIRNASINQLGTYTIPPGNYRFSAGGGFGFQQLQNLHIVADGVTFWFDEPLVYGVIFENCTNIKITGLTIDYDPIPFCQGQITAINGSVATVQITPGYALNSPSGAVVFYKPNGDFIIKGHTGGSVSAVSATVLNVTTDLSGVAVGDYLVLPMRTGQTVRIYSCTNFTLEDVNIFSTPGMGVNSSNSHNTVLRRVKITRRPNTNRLHCSGADGIHVANDSFGPIIENCEISHLGDDIINLHGFFGWVSARQSATHFRVISNSNSYVVGQKLYFRDRNTLAESGEAKIVSVTKLSNQTEINEAKIGKPNLFDGDVYDLVLDTDITAQRDATIENRMKVCSNFVIRDSYFHDTFNRALLLNGPINGTVTNNTFSNIYGGIGIHMETWQYMEGQFIRNLKFTNNILNASAGMGVTVNPPPQVTFRDTPMSNITISNNVINLRPGYSRALDVLYVDTVNVSNNHVSRTLLPGFPLLGNWGHAGVNPGSAYGFGNIKNAIIHNNTVSELGLSLGEMNPVGYRTKNVTLNGTKQPDAITDHNTGWFISGVQNDDGWSYGFLNTTLANAGTYNSSSFEQATHYDGRWHRSPSEYYPYLAKEGFHPGSSHAACKRWTSKVAGGLKLIMKLQCGNIGNGVKAFIFQDGVKKWEYDTYGNNGTNEFNLVLNEVAVGSKIDFVVDAKGWADYDAVGYEAKILHVTSQSSGSMAQLLILPENGSVATMGGTAINDVRANDHINDEVATSVNSTLAKVGTWPVGIDFGTAGSIYVLNGTPAGTYTLRYKLCDLSGNCAEAANTVEVMSTVVCSVSDTVPVIQKNNN